MGRRKDNFIKKYTQVTHPGSFSGFDKFKRSLKNVKSKDLKDKLLATEAYNLHFPVKKKFRTSQVIVPTKDHTWQADLVDVSALAKENKNHKFILTVIDVFSKFAWAVPLLSKSGEEIVKAFQSIFKGKRIPRKLHTDQGKEFFNKKFLELLEKNNIKLYSTNSQFKASVVERFNRTIKQKMWRLFTFNHNKQYLNYLPGLIKSYNATYHRSIKMAPIDVNAKNEDQVFLNLFGFEKTDHEFKSKIKFQIGDLVRISVHKYLFAKGYTNNWSRELFEVNKVLLRDPVVYTIKDANGEEIEGKFYNEDLLKVEKDLDQELFEIDKVLKIRTKNGRVEKLVSWVGYPASANSWIPAENIEK